MSEGSGSSPSLPIRYDGNEYDDRFYWVLEGRDGTLVLSIVGRATHPVSEEFADQVKAVLTQVVSKRLLIDMRDCEQIASASLGFLVQIFRQAVRLGFQPVGICPQANIRKLMDVLGMSDFLLLVDDEETAEKFFSAQGI